jgi:hypothetical protein
MAAEDSRWRDFQHLPGTHLVWRQVSLFGRELVARDGTVLAQMESPKFRSTHRITTGGRTFEERLMGKRRSPNRAAEGAGPTAEAIGQRPPDLGPPRQMPSHFGPRSLVDESTGDPIFWIEGMHLNRQAHGLVYLSSSTWFTFPVQGKRSGSAVMRAVDQSGSSVLKLRMAKDPSRQRGRRRGIEILLAPGVASTSETICLSAVAASFLNLYFVRDANGS